MKFTAIALAAAYAAGAEVYFEESFDGDWTSRWTEGKPAGKEMGKWDVTNGKWFVDEEVNKGLTTTEDMRFYSITAPMTKPSTSKGKSLVIQFSAKIEYHHMFGPDLCGYDVSHIHAIFNHKGENLLKTE